MDARHFDATTISRAAAIGSLLTLPLPIVIGGLADRIGRKTLIMACFLAPTLGLLIQIAATQPWHFLASSVLSTIVGVSTVAGAALLSDSFPKASLGTALALLNATPWIGIVFGLSAGGLVIRTLQMTLALLLAALLGFVALLLLLPIAEAPSEQRTGGAEPTPTPAITVAIPGSRGKASGQRRTDRSSRRHAAPRAVSRYPAPRRSLTRRACGMARGSGVVGEGCTTTRPLAMRCRRV